MARGPGARDGEEPGLEWHSNSKAWASTAVGVLPALRGVSHARDCRRSPEAAPDPAPPDIRAWKLEGKVGCTPAGAGRFFSENPYETPS